MQIEKSERHSKITGDFGESLILYFLSKSGFEVLFVDYCGIDLIAFNKKSKKRIGISVKSRSKKVETKDKGLLVIGKNFQKIMNACKYFDSMPYISFVIDVPGEDSNGNIYLYLMSLETLLKYYPAFGKNKSFTFSMSLENIKKYEIDKDISKLKFKYKIDLKPFQ